MSEPALAASVVVRDEDGRFLLVQRGREPARGLWSVPGGKVESGEDPRSAAAREVREETGLRVQVGGVIDRATVRGSNGTVYDIHCFVARVLGGRAQAGDDADRVGWFTLDEVGALQTTPGLTDLLRRGEP